MVDLRGQRLYRSFRARREWYEWCDAAFDPNVMPKHAPWAAENVKKMDTINFAENIEVMRFGERKFDRPPVQDAKSDTF